MRKKINISAIALSLALTLTLTACGQDPTDGESSSQDQSQTSETVSEAEPETSEAAAEISDDSSDDTAEETTDEDPQASSIKLYEALLAGEESMSVSKTDFEETDQSFDSSRTYTLPEFLEAFFESQTIYYYDQYAVDGLSYAYIDLGQDGSDELVLSFISKLYDYGEEHSNIMVVKDLDGQLALCYWISDGYRSYNYINTYGVIARGGSGGAADHGLSYTGLDENGDPYLIYGLEECDCNSLYFADDTDYGQLASDLGVDNIIISRYYFEDFVYDESQDFDIEAYCQYMKDCYYSYGVYDENYEIQQNDELYAADSSYVEFMSKVTDNCYRPDDMQQILDDRLSQFGLTEDMLGENAPDWTNWEGHDDIFENTQYTVQQ